MRQEFHTTDGIPACFAIKGAAGGVHDIRTDSGILQDAVGEKQRLPHEDVLTMFWTACVANRVYRLARRRNTSDIVTLLISLAFLIWNLVKFFQMA